MILLAIISDDFTGALDTGVQFVRYNLSVKILTWEKLQEKSSLEDSADVLVIDAETRHINPEEAYQLTRKIVFWAVKQSVPHIYIKTDSGLRGNIGSTLKAALDASGENFLPFLPAYPDINRTTRDGIQYIGQMPIQKSIFGKDPFEPVVSHYIKDLFKGSGVETENIKISKSYHTDFAKPTIGLFDVQTNDDFQRIASHLKAHNQLRVFAGCAGFASFIPGLLGFSRQPKKQRVPLNPLLVVCGSLSPVTKSQVEYACGHGFVQIALTPHQLLSSGYFASVEGSKWILSQESLFCGDTPLLIDTGILNPEAMRKYDNAYEGARQVNRKKISNALGTLLHQLFTMGYCKERTLMIVGGDTFLGFLKQLRWQYISPITELEVGTVLASIHIGSQNISIVSKSGSFGEEELQ
jgi:uncharacterized protein YgbK (DUF1537 family)